MLAELTQKFVGTHPGIRVQILDLVAEGVREAVLKRQVDFGIGTRHGRDADLIATPLFQDQLVVFAPAGHKLARTSAVSLTDLAAYDLILPARESSVRETVEAIAHRERLALQTRHETNFMPTALAFVLAGLGIAILPESAAGREAPKFARIPISSKFSNRQIELLQRRDLALSPAAESIMQHLKQHFRDVGIFKRNALPRHRRKT